LPGILPNPYHVWLSEIMLQQTTTATVSPYFNAFIQRWPTIEALASASLDEILHAWQGLGYYARARNLHRCAQIVVKQHKGCLPKTASELMTLPGIGDYTSAAIAAIAFNKAEAAIDGNVIRVGSRLFGIETPYPQSLPIIKAAVRDLVPTNRPGEFAQALMDLGSQVCTPKRPSCELCPLTDHCEGRRRDIAEFLPIKRKASPLPTRYTSIFWLIREEDNALLIQRRPEKGLLGGLFEFPSTPWQEKKISPKDAKTLAPFEARWVAVLGTVTHTFSHFHLEMRVLKGSVEGKGDAELQWCKPDNFANYAFPTIMKKVMRHMSSLENSKEK
jgi:A/G-specific adenine glycosylase